MINVSEKPHENLKQIISECIQQTLKRLEKRNEKRWSEIDKQMRQMQEKLLRK